MSEKEINNSIGLNYIWTLVEVSTNDYTSNQGEIKEKFVMLLKKDNVSKFMLESNKNPILDTWLKLWKSYFFPIWFNTFKYVKDWIDKIWTKFYLRDEPKELEV